MISPSNYETLKAVTPSNYEMLRWLFGMLKVERNELQHSIETGDHIGSAMSEKSAHVIEKLIDLVLDEVGKEQS